MGFSEDKKAGELLIRRFGTPIGHCIMAWCHVVSLPPHPRLILASCPQCGRQQRRLFPLLTNSAILHPSFCETTSFGAWHTDGSVAAPLPPFLPPKSHRAKTGTLPDNRPSAAQS